MYHKLNEETLSNLLEIGIREFAGKGFDKANISEIAKKSGLSVGVLYKYYLDKDDFFLNCVRHSLRLLDQILHQISFTGDNLEENLRLVLNGLLEHAESHNNYYLMYHEITSGGCRKFASVLAEEIETISAGVYTRLIEEAKRQGKVRQDINPKMFAFFFDNLLMMLQFSLSCDYYKKRLEIYFQGEPNKEELVNELLKFITGALGINK